VFEVRRVRTPATAEESWTLVGPDARPVALIDEFPAWLTQIERSPNTVEAYARELRLFWSFLSSPDLRWDRVTVAELGEFAAWAPGPRRTWWC
jgi:integrase/recombinase XerD